MDIFDELSDLNKKRELLYNRMKNSFGELTVGPSNKDGIYINRKRKLPDGNMEEFNLPSITREEAKFIISYLTFLSEERK